MIETPIDFYGEVVSAAGDPLEGARVTAVVFDRLTDPFEFPYFAFTQRDPVITGKDGRFAFTGAQGAGMYVVVERPGWAPVTGARQLYVYAEGLGRSETLPTRAAPERFVFEVRPPDAQLQPIHTGALRLPGDGVPLEVSIREPRPYGVPPGTGDATVTCDRQHAPGRPEEPFDWSCEIEIAGGGWHPFRIGMDRAPESGYEPRARLAYPANDPAWEDRATRSVIVRFADGNYGFVRISMRMRGDFYVAFDGVWNPTGETWLD